MIRKVLKTKTLNTMNNSVKESGKEATLRTAMERNILKEKMRQAAEKCGYGLLRFYNVAGNRPQENKMKYMLKDLLYSKTDEAEFICETIYEEANTHLAAAMKHGYSASDLAELRNSLDAYKCLLKSLRENEQGKKDTTDAIVSFRLWERRAA